ncbi:RNA-directed DNA polymerase, eukaryota, reverse transcriptase zinc-binding domain protein [Tanacetum coccineum]
MGALQEFIFSEVPDRVTWDLDESGVFSVSSMRSCLDAFLLDKIPTRLNLSDKGIDLDTLLCPVCMQTGESTEHLFSSCPNLCPLWHRIAVWWGVTTPTEMTFKSIVTWVDDVALDAKSKQVFDAVILVAFWIIWSFRNKLIFGTIKPRKDDIFEDIQSVSYFWISNRRKKCKMSWDRWMYLPNMAFSSL